LQISKPYPDESLQSLSYSFAEDIASIKTKINEIVIELALHKQNLTKLASKWALGEEVKQKSDVFEEYKEEYNKNLKCPGTSTLIKIKSIESNGII